MKVAIAGGGPGGLFLAILLRRARPDIEVVVWERNRAEDTFGFGVVFSDATLASINDADPVLQQALVDHGARWDTIEVRMKGERWTAGGNGMAAVGRKTLLALMQRRATEAGVNVRFRTEAGLADTADFDVVVAADGANSRLRTQLAEHFRPSCEQATAKFIWLGTTHAFPGLTFLHEQSPDGVFAVHGYPIDARTGTFIVETDEASWRSAGLDEFDVTQPPGPSDTKSRRYLEKLFAEHIGGTSLLVNNSRWANFRTRRAATWRHGNVVLLGDAAHTAHFSVGSGTKMAMEDAIVLADCLTTVDDLDEGLGRYEERARPSVEKIQQSAAPSLAWWEHFGRSYQAFDPWQFAFHFFSRTLPVDRLERRDRRFVEAVRARWVGEHGAPPLHSPGRLAHESVAGRVLPTDPGGVLAPCESGQTLRLPLHTAAPASRSSSAPWALRTTAPDRTTEIADAAAQAASAAAQAALVVVDGGTRFTRALLSEELRLAYGATTAIVVNAGEPEVAETAVLSGRADFVAITSEDLPWWARSGGGDLRD
ncbi:FAD-dependent monooxygenase [Dactylosporangium sp. NPDC048998]|uniref:FAD-dependent monooxygenase n=1 Tax=Dactylosporangium sp. NPDC048998 TaxID=3363976 RepID=UPI0037188DE5